MKKFTFVKITLVAALSVSGVLAAPSASATQDAASEETPAARAPGREHAPPKGPKSSPGKSAAHKPIKGAYIVTLKPGTDPEKISRGVGASPRFVYRSALNGFAADLNEGQLNGLRHHPHVEMIEEDQEGGLTTTQNMDWYSGQPWGLDRIDQRKLPFSRTYNYNSTGAGVRVYVIDSGLQANHPQFGNRALNMYSAQGGSSADCNGHGTHVAGTIAGSTYGVAKGASLRGVRVVDCAGHGTASQAIAGVDWVRVNSIHPAVANMSLQYGYTAALNTAVYNLAQSGVFVAAAAGNWNVNACDISPASASGAYTTGATNKTDGRWYWSASSASNYGPCVDGNAPGEDVKSAWIGSGTNTITGTSMASPHVAGTAALYKATYGDHGWSTITNWINANSTTGVLTGLTGGTPNRLLYKAGL